MDGWQLSLSLCRSHSYSLRVRRAEAGAKLTGLPQRRAQTDRQSGRIAACSRDLFPPSLPLYVTAKKLRHALQRMSQQQQLVRCLPFLLKNDMTGFTLWTFPQLTVAVPWTHGSLHSNASVLDTAEAGNGVSAALRRRCQIDNLPKSKRSLAAILSINDQLPG